MYPDTTVITEVKFSKSNRRYRNEKKFLDQLSVHEKMPRTMTTPAERQGDIEDHKAYESQ